MALRPRSLEASFDRFRRNGDLRALGRVFDGTARELLGLAQHLVRDVDDAEDLVQATFVTAIERADSWDRGRGVRPWLAGILALKARNLARARVRHAALPLEDAADAPARSTDPASAAQHGETSAELARALQRLAPAQREVLERYLLEGRRPEEIARELARAPGTVRAQIARGLERLRAQLPARASAVLALGLGPRPALRGLPSLRAEVLRVAARTFEPALAAAPAAPVAGGAVLFLGGQIVSKTVGLALGAAALVTAVGVWTSSSSPTTPAVVPGRSIQVASDDAVPVLPERATLAAPAAREERHEVTATGEAVRARGHVWVEGRARGLSPGHGEGLKVDVRGVWTQDGRMRNVPYVSFLDAGASGARITLNGVVLDQDGAVLDAKGAAGGEGASVEVRPDGTYRLDLTDFVLEHQAFPRLQLVPHHELYLATPTEFDVDPRCAARVAAGHDVVHEVDLELVPAALLRGKVVEDDAPASGFALAGAEGELQASNVYFVAFAEETGASSGSGDEASLGIPLTAWLGATEDGTATLPRSISFRFVLSAGRPDVALLRPGSPHPLAQCEVEPDGSFELKVAEEGPCVLVALTGERSPVSLPVELHLLEVTELEEELHLPRGERLEGLVEDLGAMPNGGIELRAERISAPDDLDIDWQGHDLAWSGGAVVRRARTTTTDDQNRFTFQGLSSGYHRLSFARAGAVSALAEGDSPTLEVPVPASGVQLLLPLAVLEVTFTVPEVTRALEELSVRLKVLDPETGREVASVELDALSEEPHRLVAPPHRRVRLEIEHETLAFPAWEGAAPAAGERAPVQLLGEFDEEGVQRQLDR